MRREAEIDNGLVDRGGEKSVIPALQLTHSGTGVKETQTLKCCGKNLGKTWVKLRFCVIFVLFLSKNIGKNDGFSS